MQKLWDYKMFISMKNEINICYIQVTIFKCLYCIQLDTIIDYHIYFEKVVEGYEILIK